MNTNKPIGVFDSGVGGLTVVRHLQKKLPHENIIYFGDTARVPYGTKAPETIKKFSLEITDFLVEKGIKCLVIACNTASSHAIHIIQKRYPKLPVYGMIESGSEFAITQSKSNRIGIIGTSATIKSDAYRLNLEKLNSQIITKSISCPLFVPIVEEGIEDDRLIEPYIEYYLRPLKEDNIDTLILGCTHYPLLKDRINSFFDGKINLIDSGEAAAEYVSNHLEMNGFAAQNRNPFYHCYLTSSTNKFFSIAKNCLIKQFNEVNYVDID